MKTKVSSDLWSWVGTEPAVRVADLGAHRLQLDTRLLAGRGGVQNLIRRRHTSG